MSLVRKISIGRDYKNDESEGVKNFTTTWTFDKYEISKYYNWC